MDVDSTGVTYPLRRKVSSPWDMYKGLHDGAYNKVVPLYCPSPLFDVTANILTFTLFYTLCPEKN